MISSFFSRTKPVNYVVTIGFAAMLFLLATFLYDNPFLKLLDILPKLATLVLLLLTVFVINPVVTRNKLAELNSFAMLFYVLLLAAFFPLLQYDALLISNFLVVLSADKVLSLKHEKRTTFKIFEAAILVFMASLFNEWALVFLIPVYLGVYAYSPNQLRHWLLPIAAFTSVGLTICAFLTVTDNLAFLNERFAFRTKTSFDGSNSYAVIGYAILGFISIGVALVKLNNRGMGRIVSLRILASYFVLGVVITFVSENFGRSTISYTFFAIAIFLSNYFETIQKRRFKEVLLIAMVLVPLVLVATYVFNSVSL